MKTRNITLILALLTLCDCQSTQKKHAVGVSQCSDDIWRDKQNQELITAAFFHDDIELHFANANDNSEQQIQQIDSLVDNGIDLLIVAPNQMSEVTPAIDRAYDKGIPVIVFERKTNSHNSPPSVIPPSAMPATCGAPPTMPCPRAVGPTRPTACTTAADATTCSSRRTQTVRIWHACTGDISRARTSTLGARSPWP